MFAPEDRLLLACPIVDDSREGYPLSFFVDGLESYPTRQSLDHRTPFGVEGYIQFLQLLFFGPVVGKAFGARIEGYLGLVGAFFRRVVKDRKHPGIVGPLPVEHGPGVGAYLVKTAYLYFRRVGQRQAARCPAVLHLQLLSFQYPTFGTEQLDIQYPAQIGRTIEQPVEHIGGVPYRLSHVVTRVVEVQVDLLLRVGQRETVGRSGKGKQGLPNAVGTCFSDRRVSCFGSCCASSCNSLTEDSKQGYDQ